MLVLTRLPDQAIIINGNIKITVVEVRGNRVRIGVEAPKEVPIHREEVYNEMLDSKGSAPSLANPAT